MGTKVCNYCHVNKCEREKRGRTHFKNISPHTVWSFPITHKTVTNVTTSCSEFFNKSGVSDTIAAACWLN